jgi:hypothetical protein
MNEQEIRAFVREVIARQANAPAPRPGADLSLLRQHASHGLLVLPAGADTDGPCIIEPSVSCNHCGYCKSYGH